MNAYVYLDNDFNLNVRDADFLDLNDPGFFNRNAHIIHTLWRVDSESQESVKRMLDSFKRMELKFEPVRIVCSQIGFNLDAFLAEHKSKKQPLFHTSLDQQVNTSD
jgi:hypothetical protein